MNQTRITIFTVALSAGLWAETLAIEPKELTARRVTHAPRIDGELDDEAWYEGAEKVQFFQFTPANGKQSEFYSSIQLVYTDKGIYIGAHLYDPQPNKILKEFGQRDDIDRNADYFGILLDTYNSGLNAFAFVVSAAGVQSDIYFTANDEDDSWDAVWNSAVTITDDGWIVEIEIPYFALRFPKQEVQAWGINFYRNVKRKQEESFWNHVDNSIRGIVNQSGRLTGLENIKPPLRLGFYPYASGIFNHDGNSGKSELFFAGGMDLKYGLNESYTLDVSLIPDFTQVQSDNIVYNITAYEVRFNENRQFFTEGTELFNKANLFYSRRVGQSFGRVNYDPETERILSQPTGASLINAIKLSGRNKKGLGVGFFNGLTANTYATIENTETGERRKVQVDPLTNFSMIVVDQNLKNNSNISFTNTNVIRDDGGRDANVAGVNLSLRDKKNTYQLSYSGSISTIIEGEDSRSTDTGYKYFIELARISGKWQYGVGRNVESYNYNINDMGYLQAPNEVTHFGYFRYNILKPVGIINRMHTGINTSYQRLHKPDEFTSFRTFLNVNTQFKNFWWVGFNFGGSPGDSYDYFEPRVWGYKFRQPENFNFNLWVESDSRKSLQINLFTGQFHRPVWDQWFAWGGFYVRYRVNNKLSFNTEVNHEKGFGRGYATRLYSTEGVLQDIIFGHRMMQTTTNIFGLNYTFNNKMGFRIRLRHYWSKVRYEQFYTLGVDGELYPTSYNGLDANDSPKHDANFNAINMDFVYFFQIAPGSFLNFVWKDAIQTFTNNTRPDYLENLRDCANSPQVNSISLRLTYFIDYVTIRNSIKRR
jgi:hypothetical protein